LRPAATVRSWFSARLLLMASRPSSTKHCATVSLIGEIADGVSEARPGEDGPREILAHVLDLRQQWHGLLVAQDTASVAIEIRAACST
jgi:hypothetical protein